MHVLNSSLLPRRGTARTKVGVIYLVIPNSTVQLKIRAYHQTSSKPETRKLLLSGMFTLLSSASDNVKSQEIDVFIAEGCDCSGGGGGLLY